MKTYETIMIAIGSCTLLVSLLVLIVEVVKVIAR
ncbi:putative holin-like toxin [Desulfosporosinus sp. BICA1-9]|nr:putative holin-like toxin [Desulfosporosinus sp. BICA1-9]